VDKRLAIVTCAGLPDGDPDDQLLASACRALGFDATVLAWTDAAVDWAGFAAAVLRSTWDYTDRRDEFLTWAARVPHLFNPYDVVRANSDKKYLRDLAEAGLPVVTTTFVRPDESVALAEYGEYVIKPTVGAGSRGAGRFHLGDDAARAAAHAHLASLQAAGRTAMVQPYLDGVDNHGETAMIFIDGEFSHAIRKGAMLAPAARFGVDEDSLYVEETIGARTASAEELDVAIRVLAHVSAGRPEPLLYARIDLLPGEAGPVVVEAELTEPSLFLAHAPGAADRLAAALERRVG